MTWTNIFTQFCKIFGVWTQEPEVTVRVGFYGHHELVKITLKVSVLKGLKITFFNVFLGTKSPYWYHRTLQYQLALGFIDGLNIKENVVLCPTLLQVTSYFVFQVAGAKIVQRLFEFLQFMDKRDYTEDF